jgi:hypothetical protein
MQGNNDLFTVLLARATSGGGGGEGFTPTDEQLAAMNSGITSTDVEQISINETNILSLQQQVGYANTELEGVL